MKKQIFFCLASSILFLGCNQNATNTYKNEVCIVNENIFSGVEPNCKNGQVFYFQPSQLMNKQIPIVVSTYFCDFKFPIVQNEGGVTCVYKRKFNVATIQQPAQVQQNNNQQNTQTEQPTQQNNTQKTNK
ncbi:hypothetical protein [Campylobacter sp. MG1]|uniref:hypothetical protein n=1 Tax=Campylobacter sp. MG1 TaxID=2976332 RepID=UPI00226CFA69|nr:hypothetical protein [Campylobacter sp. MG1]